jgi:dTDP-glucose 4,6-dehydratase
MGQHINKKILVTGATGFIGSHLVESLLARGHCVRALAHYRSQGVEGHLSQVARQQHSNLEIVVGDVTDSGRVRSLVDGVDTVYHLAALIAIPYSYLAAESYLRVNALGALNVAKACLESGVRRVIHTSTSEVYGSARYQPIDEEHPLQAQSPYAASKIAADKIMESSYLSFGLPVVTVRPFNCYGPRQSARAIIPAIVTQVVTGSKEIRLGALWPERDFTFVEDTVAGFLALAECEQAVGQVINVGSRQKISVGALAQRIVEFAGRGTTPIVSTEERHRPAKSEVGLLLADTNKMRELTGWEPSVSLDEGLGRTIEYVIANLDQYRPGTYQL